MEMPRNELKRRLCLVGLLWTVSAVAVADPGLAVPSEQPPAPSEVQGERKVEAPMVSQLVWQEFLDQQAAERRETARRVADLERRVERNEREQALMRLEFVSQLTRLEDLERLDAVKLMAAVDALRVQVGRIEGSDRAQTEVLKKVVADLDAAKKQFEKGASDKSGSLWKAGLDFVTEAVHALRCLLAPKSCA